MVNARQPQFMKAALGLLLRYNKIPVTEAQARLWLRDNGLGQAGEKQLEFFTNGALAILDFTDLIDPLPQCSTGQVGGRDARMEICDEPRFSTWDRKNKQLYIDLVLRHLQENPTGAFRVEFHKMALTGHVTVPVHTHSWDHPVPLLRATRLKDPHKELGWPPGGSHAGMPDKGEYRGRFIEKSGITFNGKSSIETYQRANARQRRPLSIQGIS